MLTYIEAKSTKEHYTILLCFTLSAFALNSWSSLNTKHSSITSYTFASATTCFLWWNTNWTTIILMKSHKSQFFFFNSPFVYLRMFRLYPLSWCKSSISRETIPSYVGWQYFSELSRRINWCDISHRWAKTVGKVTTSLLCKEFSVSLTFLGKFSTDFDKWFFTWLKIIKGENVAEHKEVLYHNTEPLPIK